MEDSNRPASPNLVVEELSSFELTRSNSDEASSSSAENSADILHPSVIGRPVDCVAWTDKKHNKYLDSLEASFVRQLHRSMDSLACRKEHNGDEKELPHKLPAGVHKASEQFAVLQDGGWQKIIVEDGQPFSYIAAIKIPWVHRRGLGGKVTLVSADQKNCHEFYHKAQLKGKRFIYHEAASLENSSKGPCYCNPVGSNEEGSGQNFVDENWEECSNAIPLQKRLKTVVEDF